MSRRREGSAPAAALLPDSVELLQLAYDAIYVWDVDSNALTFWNLAAERLYGWRTEEVLGRAPWELLSFPGFPEPLEEVRSVLARAGRWEGEVAQHRKDGKELLVAARWALRRDLAGRPAAIIAINRDITEARHAQEALHKLNTELEDIVAERTRQLERSNHELEAFAYSVSHDLRAPLRSMMGFSRILLDEYSDRLDKDGSGHVRRIAHSAERMGELIDQLLRFSRLSRQESKRQWISPKALVAESLEDLAPEMEGRDVSVRVDEMPRCLADPVLLRQVYSNLLANALKFTRTKEKAFIEVGSERTADGKCAYFVKDNGVGFDMRYADKLYEVFQRLHTRSSFEGTGIGLAIVQRIVQRHGGKVWADGAIGEGARFYFTLGGGDDGEPNAN